MAIDEETRHRIHRRLEELLGRGEAAALMAQIAPIEWGDVATKGDLRQLEERMELRLRAEINGLRADLAERLAELSSTFVRSTVAAVVGSVLSVAALVFAGRIF